MTSPDTPPPARRQVRVVLVGILLIAVATLWWVSELYTADARRACQEMYAGAKSASDTNRIDLVAPAALRGRTHSEPRTCATYRDRVPQ